MSSYSGSITEVPFPQTALIERIDAFQILHETISARRNERRRQARLESLTARELDIARARLKPSISHNKIGEGFRIMRIVYFDSGTTNSRAYLIEGGV